jgi:hypothetical protein
VIYYSFSGSLLLEEKRRPSIIGRTCRFDTKIRGFLRRAKFVSACVKGSKKIFRKIEISQNLPSFFAEKWANIGGIEYIVFRQMRPFGRLV